MFRSKKHNARTLEVNRHWLERLELLKLTSQMKAMKVKRRVMAKLYKSFWFINISTYNEPIKYFGSVTGVMFSNGTQEFALIPIKIVHEIGRFSTTIILANNMEIKLKNLLYIYMA